MNMTLRTRTSMHQHSPSAPMRRSAHGPGVSTRAFARTCALTSALTIALALCVHPAAAQTEFRTPDAAVQALTAAAKAADEKALVEIFGEKHRNIVDTRDNTQDRQNRARFAAAASEYMLLRPEKDGRITLIVGAEAYPFPIPLVKSGSGWKFDAAAGAEELINRRIGRNELLTIETLHYYVDAQRLYAAKSRDGSGVREFAQRLASSPGKRNGLYWDADVSKGDEASPIGPLMRDASTRTTGTPYNGYYYRILKSQGPDAPGGRYNYIVNGRMLSGYAMVAYPADYNVSGVKTFIVNHYGQVYEKDLGPNTAKRAAAMTEYNPDRSWTYVEP